MYKFSLWISIREKLSIVPQDNHACATELGQEWMWRWCDSLLTWTLKEERPEKAGIEGHARLASHGWRHDQRRLTRMDMHAWHPMGGGMTREALPWRLWLKCSLGTWRWASRSRSRLNFKNMPPLTMPTRVKRKSEMRPGRECRYYLPWY